MIVRYSPDGGPAQTWEWDANRVRSRAAEDIERLYGGRWQAFPTDVLMGSMRARRILLWHLMRLEHPTVRLDDIDFAAGELVVDFSDSELADVRAAVDSATDIDLDKRAQALRMLDAEIASRAENPEAQGDGVPGKAISS